MSLHNNHINYIEFKTHDLEKTKQFYQQAFDWVFTDYGPTYIAFEESGIAGGFETTEEPIVHGALVVLYHKNLETCIEHIEKAGGTISLATFSFPGGKRFHFLDPSGNQLAVWSEE